MPVVCVCLVSQVLANPSEADPPKPAAQAPATDTSASSSSTASATPGETTDPSKQPAHVQVGKVVLVDKTATDAQVKELLSMGYKPQANGDQVVYCRRETTLGSHFETKTCRTAEQIALLRKDSKEMADTMHQRGATPSGK
jgi:hypothetical protein